MTKIVDIEDIRKKREKKEIGIPIENINKKELKRRGHEIGDILGCDEKGEEICVRKGKGNLYVDGDMEKEQLFDFMRSQIYQNIQRGDSMVIVDLGSRIYKRELWIYLTIHGYRVDSYNMDCMTESDCFNCLDGLGAENEEQIVMIANDIIDDQKYKFMTYPVETACKALLSAVMLASLTEMEESDRNMLEIATIFRLGVSKTMLDKILYVMFEELDETSSAKQLFAMYSEAEEGIRMEAIQKIGNALAVYEKRANGSLCDNFRTNRYDMEMPVKEKSVLFIESGQLPEDKVLFSVFMERLYDSMLKKAEERQQDVTVMLLDYPYYGGICGLEKYMEEGPEKGICTTLYEDDRKLDGSGYAPHLVELYSQCDISVCIKDTEIPLCEIEKCENPVTGECSKRKDGLCYYPATRNQCKEFIIGYDRDKEEAMFVTGYLYNPGDHPYKIPENVEELLTMWSESNSTTAAIDEEEEELINKWGKLICIDVDDLIEINDLIKKDGYDAEGFQLEEVPHPNVYCFVNHEKKQCFDVVRFADGPWNFSYLGYEGIGDTSVLVNKPADSIKEAIEKYKDVAGQFV